RSKVVVSDGRRLFGLHGNVVADGMRSAGGYCSRQKLSTKLLTTLPTGGNCTRQIYTLNRKENTMSREFISAPTLAIVFIAAGVVVPVAGQAPATKPTPGAVAAKKGGAPAT